MQPAQCDIQLYRGDYFEMTLRLRAGTFDGTAYTPGAYLDLTGWSAAAQIRANEDATAILATLDAEVVDPENGTVHLSLSGDDSATLTVPTAVWDVQLTDTSDHVHTYLRGAVAITKDVTRP